MSKNQSSRTAPKVVPHSARNKEEEVPPAPSDALTPGKIVEELQRFGMPTYGTNHEIPRVRYDGYVLSTMARELDLLGKDADGDEIHSYEESEDLSCGDVIILIPPSLEPRGAVRLLRKVATIIETYGLNTTGKFIVYTDHPAMEHVRKLKAMVDALRESSEAA